MFERMTADARAVLARIPRLILARAPDRRQLTPWDLAAALSAPSGNTAALWHASTAEAPPGADPATAQPTNAAEPATAAEPAAASTAPSASVDGAAPRLRFDGAARAVLDQALRVALQERAQHIGTEHLLAALVRTGPPDVVTWLAARGATVQAVDTLLARLHGGLGVDSRPSI